MTALSTLTDALKRELAVPGTFDDVFPDTGDSDLVGSLADGFAEAQLQGFFPTMSLTQNGGGWETSEDLSLSGGALIVIFASMRTIRAQLRNLKTVEKYKAGAAEFETQQAATILKAELDFLQKRLDDIIAAARTATRVSGTLAGVYDNYLSREYLAHTWSAFHSWEWREGWRP